MILVTLGKLAKQTPTAIFQPTVVPKINAFPAQFATTVKNRPMTFATTSLSVFRVVASTKSALTSNNA